MDKNEYTVSNICGGNLRTFRLNANGQISDAMIRHARTIGFGGPMFAGPAGEQAERQWDDLDIPYTT